MKNWYKSWFQSPYYHLLYKNRNDLEANFFLNNLIDFLNPETNNQFLDIASKLIKVQKISNKNIFPGCHIHILLKTKNNLN